MTTAMTATRKASKWSRMSWSNTSGPASQVWLSAASPSVEATEASVEVLEAPAP